METTIFLFDIDNLIIVYSVNVNELINSINHSFGDDFDGNLYLKQLYDELYILESYDYLHYLGLKDSIPRARIIEALDILNMLTFRELSYIEMRLFYIFNDSNVFD